MKLRVFPTPREWNEDDVRGGVAVVIDVLRASSTITQALVNGAREIVPVATPAEAGELAAKAGRSNVILGGERDSKVIEGFDLGNSPFEYSSERVNGRTIIFASTNGAPALVRAKGAEQVLIGCFNNLGATVQRLRESAQDVAILCSGRYGKFSLEDFVCAGKMVEGLLPQGTVANDGAHAALDLFKYYRSQIPEVVRNCVHGKYLAELGFSVDLEHCARLDIFQVVPALIEGKVRLPKQNGIA